MDYRLRYLHGLRYFEAAARLNSYTRASEELFVSQAAVSQQIRKLEEQLACELFVREGREMTLTPKGNALYQDVSRAFSLIINSLNKMESEPIEGVLVVGSPPSFASRWLLPRLWEFSLKHPEIPIRVLAKSEVPNLKLGEVDVAIVQGENPFVEEELSHEVLINEPIYPYCSPQFAEYMKLNKPEDLLNCWLVYFESGCYPWEWWFKCANVSTIDNSIQWVAVGTFDMAINTVVSGHGVCLATDSLAGDLIERGLLVKLFDIGLTPGVQINLCLDPSSPRRERIQAFNKWLHKALLQY
ncbi:LysR substrate-binding domain-containing protein [Vibrio harveyi]|uniref:LysR substrate-binding domain-containing protein n=1 Tax=Vibrio harveyi TaxID=669 RepID=UPI003909DF4A